MKNFLRRPVRLQLAGWVLAGILSGTGVGVAGELLIIGNPDVPAPQLDAKGLQRIYMGKQTRWLNDEAIVPVMLREGPLHDTFVEDYLDRSVHRFVTYWRQMVFTGKGLPPRSFNSEDELIDFVAVTPGALGYASSAADTGRVKVLPVVAE